ncbi:hypothetical protein ANCCAN_13365 [Ancylostoma caninum]|uniref:Uncharacterized protein n=1 Tax=Ancylostoma caninum TaxID=29170 RepID=A0A368G8H8_ANCCA|nr:hypothetical protein ANCCAN_13365 [Ancylostoma caninum]
MWLYRDIEEFHNVRVIFRSHSRQASQGVPYRNVEKPRRIRDIRDKQWQEKQNEIIELEMSVLVQESQCGIGKWRLVLNFAFYLISES